MGSASTAVLNAARLLPSVFRPSTTPIISTACPSFDGFLPFLDSPSTIIKDLRGAHIRATYYMSSAPHNEHFLHLSLLATSIFRSAFQYPCRLRGNTGVRPDTTQLTTNYLLTGTLTGRLAQTSKQKARPGFQVDFASHSSQGTPQ